MNWNKNIWIGKEQMYLGGTGVSIGRSSGEITRMERQKVTSVQEFQAF